MKTSEEAMSMQSLAESEKLITGEVFAMMGDLWPCELVEGKVVRMSPTNWRHGRCVSRLDRYLRDFVEGEGRGEVLAGEVGIYIKRDPDTVRGADLVFISHERLARVASESFLDVAPELVVEVVSPGNTWDEMRQKIDEYFAIGVDRVWLVEPERRKVLVYQAPDAVRILEISDVLAGEGVLNGFTLALGDLFDA